MGRLQRTAAWACLSVALALATISTPAQAKKIPIPCTGETLVKVLDIPATQSALGKRVDLGYKYTGCSGGEWVGHIGSGTQYVRLTPEMLQALLDVAGLKAPPAIPSRLTNGGYGYFWPIILGLGLVFGLFKLLFRSRRRPTEDHESPADQSAQLQRGDLRISDRQQLPRSAPHAPAPSAARMPTTRAAQRQPMAESLAAPTRPMVPSATLATARMATLSHNRPSAPSGVAQGFGRRGTLR